MIRSISKLVIIFLALIASPELAGQHGWNVDPADYEYDGEVNAIVLSGTTEITTGTVGAFVGSTCRGFGDGVFFEKTGKTVFSIRCYSNVVSGETLTFKWFDPSSSTYHDIVETVQFFSNMVEGTAASPLTFHIFVCTPVSITAHPSSDSMCEEDGSAGFSVSVNGTLPFVYQWQYYNGSAWANVTDGIPAGAVYTGANTSNLGVADITVPGDYQYRCNITNCGTEGNVNSNPATLTVNALPAKPLITALGPVTFCSGGSVTLMSAAGSSYLWSTGATTQSITVTASGSYTVQVTNSNGCQSVPSDPVVVTVNPLPPAPTITPSGPLTFCTGGSVTLTSSTGSTYLWSTGATARSINVSLEGTYTVRITNANGCQSPPSAPVVVTVNPLPEAPTITASGPTTFCQGGSVTLTSSTGTTYLWSNGATTRSINVSQSGNYIVSITNSDGCISPASSPVTVTVNPLPGVNAGNNVNIPTGTSTKLNGTVTGTGPFTYSWTPASSLVNPAVEDPTTVNLTTTTTFTLTATIVATGCSASDDVTVSVTGGLLSASPSATPGTVCSGSSVQLDAGASGGSGTYTYAWTSVPAGFTSTLSSPVVTPSVNTTYQVTVNDGFSSVNGQVAVTVNPLPAKPTITASGPTTFCIGGGVTLTSTTATGYLWSTGATTRSINVITSGSYSVKVRNISGCLSEWSDPVVVTARPLPKTPVIQSITHPTCTNPTGSITLADLPETGVWTLTRYAGEITTTGTGSVTTINGLPSGTYNFTVRDESGCTSLVSANAIINAQPVTPSPPVVGTITHPSYTVPTGSVVLTGLPSGTWRLTRYPGGIIITGSGASRTVSGLEPGTYTFTVTNAVGCTSASSASVLINARPGPPTVIITNPDTICSISTADLTRPEITAGSDANLTYSYWLGPDTTTAQRVPDPRAVPPGTYYIKGSSTANYYTIVPVTVNADQMPVADAGPDQVLEFIFNTTMDALIPEYGTGIWSLESGTGNITDTTNAKSTVTDLSLGRNEFTWTVTNGVCPPVSDKVTLTVNDLTIPTLITPNMDGNNDYLVIRGIENLGRAELVVFDRRGVEVFRDQNYSNNWDGVDYNKDPLPDDTYFYLITTSLGRTMRGFVVVRR